MATRFTAAQEAAIAKLAFVAEHPGAVALLCGPAGVGKTTLLTHLFRRGMPHARGVRLCDAAEDRSSDDGPHGRAEAADVLLVDNADRTTAADLVALVESWWRRQPGTVVVLAGRGRLLSLCLGDDRLERRVGLRATIPVCTIDESRRLLAPVLGAAVGGDGGESVLDTIHEIAGGAAGAALRLAEMAAVLAAGEPGRRLVPDDIEAIHRRLSLRAA